MKKIFFIPILALGIFIWQGCDQYDDLPYPGENKSVESTFKTMYADVAHVEWEKKGKYWIAEFWKEDKETEAWFETNDSWYQTETDISFAELPETVKTAFQLSEYKDWRVDDVDMFERRNTDTFYILDVEKGNREYDLYYSSNGTMIKKVADN